jgi:hypothetical protein
MSVNDPLEEMIILNVILKGIHVKKLLDEMSVNDPLKEVRL